MSYHVDPLTLSFTDLDAEEVEELLNFCNKIVSKGYVDMTHPAFLQWLEALETLGPVSPMMVYSVAFPQHALLAVAKILWDYS